MKLDDLSDLALAGRTHDINDYPNINQHADDSPTVQGGRRHTSTSTLHLNDKEAGPPAMRGPRLRLKPAHRSCGFVQGAWWPRSIQLSDELPVLLAALSQRVDRIDRVVYDDNGWAPAPSHIEFRDADVTLDGSSDHSINTLSVIGEQFGRLVLLVVPPYTDPNVAYMTVMAAASPDDVSTADELLGIGVHEAEDRRLTLIAQQRWETEGGALRQLGHERG